MKKNFKNYGFVMGVAVAVIGALVAVGNVVGFKVDDIAITSIFTAVLGVLVALGLIEKPDEKENQDDNLLNNSTNQSNLTTTTEDETNQNSLNITDDKM